MRRIQHDQVRRCAAFNHVIFLQDQMKPSVQYAVPSDLQCIMWMWQRFPIYDNHVYKPREHYRSLEITVGSLRFRSYRSRSQGVWKVEHVPSSWCKDAPCPVKSSAKGCPLSKCRSQCGMQLSVWDPRLSPPALHLQDLLLIRRSSASYSILKASGINVHLDKSATNWTCLSFSLSHVLKSTTRSFQEQVSHISLSWIKASTVPFFLSFFLSHLGFKARHQRCPWCPPSLEAYQLPPCVPAPTPLGCAAEPSPSWGIRSPCENKRTALLEQTKSSSIPASFSEQWPARCYQELTQVHSSPLTWLLPSNWYSEMYFLWKYIKDVG